MMNLNPLWSAMSQKQLKYVLSVCTWSCTAPLSFEKNQEQQDILQLYPSWGCCTVENIAVECERRPSNDSPLFWLMGTSRGVGLWLYHPSIYFLFPKWPFLDGWHACRNTSPSWTATHVQGHWKSHSLCLPHS